MFINFENQNLSKCITKEKKMGVSMISESLYTNSFQIILIVMK